MRCQANFKLAIPKQFCGFNSPFNTFSLLILQELATQEMDQSGPTPEIQQVHVDSHVLVELCQSPIASCPHRAGCKIGSYWGLVCTQTCANLGCCCTVTWICVYGPLTRSIYVLGEENAWKGPSKQIRDNLFPSRFITNWLWAVCAAVMWLLQGPKTSWEWSSSIQGGTAPSHSLCLHKLLFLRNQAPESAL